MEKQFLNFCTRLAPVAIVLYFMAMAQLRCDAITPYNEIYDLLHRDVLPDLRSSLTWSTTTFFASLVDIWVLCSYLSFILMCVFWLGSAARRRFAICLCALYIFRTLTLLATRYPQAVTTFVNPPYVAPNIGLSGFLVMIGARVSQLDYMFSGHTSVWMLATLFVCYYGSRRFAGWLYGLFNLAGVILLLCLRMHYTADVLIAVFLGTFVFYTYHLAIDYKFPWLRAFIKYID